MRSPNGSSKLFVGEIGDNRKADISRVFSKYGEISTIYVDDNKHFAFVEFTSSSDAQRALKHAHNKTVNGARLRVEYAKPDKPSRDNNRRPVSREHSPTSTLYNHLQVTANRLPSMQTARHNYYQHQPPAMMPNSAMSRGRSLTPPSFKQNARLPSMNHLRTQDFYPSYYPPHPAVYNDPAYYRTYGDPYLMQRLPPPAFLPRTSSPPPAASSSSRAYRQMYSSSSEFDRHPSGMSRRRTRRSRSRSRRRSPMSRRSRSSREKKRRKRTQSSASPPQQQRERGPQTPPLSSIRSKKRSRSNSNAVASASEQKTSSTATSSASEDEGADDKQSNSRRPQDDDSNQKHSKRRTNE